MDEKYDGKRERERERKKNETKIAGTGAPSVDRFGPFFYGRNGPSICSDDVAGRERRGPKKKCSLTNSRNKFHQKKVPSTKKKEETPFVLGVLSII